MDCQQCNKPAVVRFTWPCSMGPQTAALCNDHAQAWSAQYKHTPAGEGLQIERLRNA